LGIRGIRSRFFIPIHNGLARSPAGTVKNRNI